VEAETIGGVMADQLLGKVLRYLRHVAGAAPADDVADGQLLEQFLSRRDQGAFETLFQRHGGMVWQVCGRLLSEPSDIEDAFQATFLVLLRKAGTLERTRSLSAWLHGVAYRVALKTRHRAWQHRHKEGQGADMNPVSPAASCEWQELRPVLDAELERLPEKLRAPLILCYFEGKTNEQAAEALGWPIGSISKRLARARELLRQRLVRRGIALSAPLLGGVVAEAPAAVVQSLFKAAGRYAAGQAAVEAFPIGVTNLAEGVLHSMWLAKLKIVGVFVLALAALGSGAAFWAHHASAARSPFLAPDVPEVKMPAVEIDPLLKGAGDRLPLDVTSRRDNPDSQHPLVTVTHARALEFAQPRAGKETSFVLVGPQLNSGEAWQPFALMRRDNVLTLVMESWTDDRPRRKNVPAHDIHQLSLGQLPAGDYELRFIWRDLFNEYEKTPYYRCRKISTGRLRFSVVPADAPPPKKFAPDVLEAKELKEAEPSAAERERPRQRLNGTVEHGLRFDLNQQARPPEVLAGTFDWVKWQQTKPVRVADIPVLAAPTPTDPLYAAVVGPVLQNAEWIHLREIVWKDRRAILYVDVWQDDGERLRNLNVQPLIVTTLEAPKRTVDGKSMAVAGAYQIDVEWTYLRPPKPKQPYAVKDRKTSTVKLAVKEGR
jgi:RNA polymerase sigma factor (sigma-70 family)